MSLRTGTEMISLSMIFNKLTGFFGLVAVFAGLKLSPLQLSMYIYSVAALVLIAFLMPHIRKQSPFQCLALAWFYLFDTIINTAFTAAFAVTWFLAISAPDNIPTNAPGSSTIEDTAGFTSPKYNVSKVDVIASPADVAAGQDAVALATASVVAATGAVGFEETVPSIFLIAAMTMVRVYFIFVVMAYARQVLRQHIHTTSASKLHLHTDGTVDVPSENPFSPDLPQGHGWRGKLGRVMVKVGESYWLGGQADDAWARGLDGRFRATKTVGGPPGTVERERRARSGTGPPPPPPNLTKV